MGAFTHIQTYTGTNVDISAATAVGAYTSTGDKLIMVDVSIDAVAGNGDYVMYVTRQIGGSGSAYRILPQTTMAAASGLTAISGQSGWVTVRNGDVLTCYVVGLAGDTTTPDWTTRWFELADTDISGLATSANLQTVDDNVDAILADTGTDGVVLKAAGLNTDAVTKIQSGLALEATLTAIKGAGWSTETLAAIDVLIDAIKAKTDNLPASPAAVGSAMTLTAAYDKAKDDVLTPLGVVDGIVDAIKAKTDNLPATPASAGEYTAAIAAIQADLDNPNQYKADVSGLATSAHVQEVEDKVDTADAVADAIKARTDQLTFTVANKVDATATTDTSNIAGDVWSYAKRTLTHPSVSAEEPEDSNTLILYRDADIAIELTDLTIPAGAKKYIFTIKDNLDGGDDQAVLQASYAIDGSEVETNTLVYINSAVPPALTNPVTFTLTETNITIDLTAEAAALLPRYERGYLNWDLKLVTDAAVTIVLQGLAQILGTSTRAIE